MALSIRCMTEGDTKAWAEMRCALWPFTTPAENAKDIANILSESDMWGFIAHDDGGSPAGFAEVSLRRYANGCENSPVPFLEGIWIAPVFRRQGAGAEMIAYVAEAMREKGFRELCSDALLENTISHEAHRNWGFSETERVVYFRKPLV